MEKMQKWVTQYYLHYNRFCRWGERGFENEKTDGRSNDELARRFRIELIEDKELDIPDLQNATPENIERLCDRFRRWVVSVGGDPEYRDSATDPRMQLFLAIDSECLEELANMTDELLPLNTAPTHEEWVRRIRTRPGWIWGFDYEAIRDYKPDESPAEERGWMQMTLGDLDGAWFNKAKGRKGEGRILRCYEGADFSGNVLFWYH
jgi:hypothetical protein